MMHAEHVADLAALEAASDDLTRNALALRLADACVLGTPDVLLRLIAREDLVNHRGTLVYSLGHFDCSAYAPVLVHVVATGGFEEAHEALQVLTRIEEASGADIRSAYLEAAAAATATEDWRRELLEDLLSAFE